MRQLSNDWLNEIVKQEQDAMLDLYEVDLSVIGGDIYRFHNGLNTNGQAVIWQGETYTPYPIDASGFEMSGQGASNRPTMTLSNLFGLITALASEHEECVGGIVKRRQVYAKYLDAANFPNGNPHANPSEEVVSIYVIEQLTKLRHDIATFTLAIPTETDNAILPARPLLRNTCAWIYRSPDCGYKGGPVADEKDRSTDDPKNDKCSKCLTGCMLRNNVRNFGGIPSARSY